MTCTHDLRERRARLRRELTEVEAEMYKTDPTPHPDDCRGCQSWDANIHLYAPPQKAD